MESRKFSAAYCSIGIAAKQPQNFRLVLVAHSYFMDSMLYLEDYERSVLVKRLD